MTPWRVSQWRSAWSVHTLIIGTITTSSLFYSLFVYRRVYIKAMSHKSAKPRGIPLLFTAVSDFFFIFCDFNNRVMYFNFIYFNNCWQFPRSTGYLLRIAFEKLRNPIFKITVMSSRDSKNYPHAFFIPLSFLTVHTIIINRQYMFVSK